MKCRYGQRSTTEFCKRAWKSFPPPRPPLLHSSPLCHSALPHTALLYSNRLHFGPPHSSPTGIDDTPLYSPTPSASANTPPTVRTPLLCFVLPHSAQLIWAERHFCFCLATDEQCNLDFTWSRYPEILQKAHVQPESASQISSLSAICGLDFPLRWCAPAVWWPLCIFNSTQGGSWHREAPYPWPRSTRTQLAPTSALRTTATALWVPLDQPMWSCRFVSSQATLSRGLLSCAADCCSPTPRKFKSCCC